MIPLIYKKTALLFFLSILCINFTSAQNIPGFLLPDPLHPDNKGASTNPKYRNNIKLPQLSALLSGNRSYDVQSYSLDLDWVNVLTVEGTTGTDRQWTGTNTIVMKITDDNVSNIDLDADFLQMIDIKVDGVSVSPTPQPVSGILTIPLTSPVAKGNNVTFTINYKYIGQYDLGFYLYPKKMFIGLDTYSDSVFVEERLAYTMSEPLDAHYWMPCNDYPNDKAVSDIKVHVPPGFLVASNGKLLELLTDNNNNQIFHWGDTTKIATYLMCATVSKYKEFSDWYHKVTNPSDSVEVRYYVWQKDYDNDTTIDGSRYNARYAFKKTPDMMKCFSTYYGEYPYVKYGMAAVIPFNAGGMEHQTMTTVHRIWLRGNWYESGIAHELSHQWLGDKITCATWADIWINEGGATFSEAIWAEYAYGKQAYVNTIMGSGQGYLYDNSVIDVPIYNLPINNLFNGSLTYNKGGFVYHMLRTMLGDSAFFTSLRDVLSKYAFNSITTDQFRDVFKADNPSPLVPFDTFFNQWIYKAGHPIFNIMTTANGNNNNVHVIISQTQSGANIPDVFLVPIKLIFFGPNSQQYIDTVMDYQRTTGYDFALPFHPDSVQIDSSYILCRTDVNSWQITSVREVAENNFESIKIVPNPVAGGSEASFNITLKESEPVDAYLVDMSGRKVSEIYKGSMNTGSYTITFPTTGLASGVYLLCCRIGANVQTDMLNIIY